MVIREKRVILVKMVLVMVLSVNKVTQVKMHRLLVINSLGLR